MTHLHIVSLSPRSGTTLLMELMTSSYDIAIYPEHEARIGERPIGNGKVYLTKSPKDIVVIGPIVKKIKDIYAIIVLRDPRDSAVSVHNEDPDNYYGTLAYWHNYLPFYEACKNHPKILAIKYEDLVTNADEVQQTISSHFKFLVEKDRFSNYLSHAKPKKESLLALKGLRKIETSSIGNWKNHKARLKAEIIRFGSIRTDLIEHGYEINGDWQNELEDIEPDFGSQHHSVFSTKKFIQKKQRSQFLRILKVWFYHTPFYLSFLKTFRENKPV